MVSINCQDLSLQDLPWLIEYNAEKCVKCGNCTAACTFDAIEFSTAPQSPSAASKAVNLGRQFIVRQKVSVKNACVGCGMCARVCPAQAIKPVYNFQNRWKLFGRYHGPIKRGGRAYLDDVSSLDKIFVGRISQMTDPALDSERHTFDILSPLGRILPPDKLPLFKNGDNLLPQANVPPVRWIYPVIFSDMSIGALSTRAWEAISLACAYLNEECGLPVVMSSGEGGVPMNLLRSHRVKYLILQIASGHFGWNRILQNLPYMSDLPCAVLIKIGQGAKPGDGGLLPAAKVSPHIQDLRGVPKTTLHSPPNHQGLYSIEEAVQKMHLSLNAAFGFKVPVAVKCAASTTSVSVYNNLLRDPYNICGGFFLDGILGGTGAANEISLNTTGHPIVSKLRDCYRMAAEQGLQGRIPLWVGGGVGLSGDAAADAFKLICLGANGVLLGRLVLQIMGCVGNEKGRCNACHTGLCPTGICTQEPKLTARFDVDKGAESLVHYMLTFDAEIKKLMAPIGNSALPVGRADALISIDKNISETLGIPYAC